jgi:hypothetical protein
VALVKIQVTAGKLRGSTGAGYATSNCREVWGSTGAGYATTDCREVEGKYWRWLCDN